MHSEFIICPLPPCFSVSLFLPLLSCCPLWLNSLISLGKVSSHGTCTSKLPPEHDQVTRPTKSGQAGNISIHQEYESRHRLRAKTLKLDKLFICKVATISRVNGAWEIDNRYRSISNGARKKKENDRENKRLEEDTFLGALFFGCQDP